MVIRTPAHKQTDSDKKPGQIVNTGWDKTLNDYIKRKEEIYGMTTSQAPVVSKQKLTFDEWYVTIRPKKNGGMPWDDWFVCMKEAWRAAQENV